MTTSSTITGTGSFFFGFPPFPEGEGAGTGGGGGGFFLRREPEVVSSGGITGGTMVLPPGV